MQKPEPTIVPPMACMVRIPQISPEVVAIRRRLYVPPAKSSQAAEQSPWLSRSLPETPRPFPLSSDTGQFAAIQKTPANVFRPTATMGMPSASAALPHSLAGYTSSTRRSDPGVGETLLGCATLFLVGIIVLLVLYYLAM